MKKEVGGGAKENDNPAPRFVGYYGVRNDQPDVQPGLSNPATFVTDRQGVVRFAKVRHDPAIRTSPELVVRELDRLLGVQGNP